MAKRKKKLPKWLHGPASMAIRAAITPALAASPERIVPLARRLARKFGSLPSNRVRLRRAESNLEVAFPAWEAERRREYALRSYEHMVGTGLEFGFGPRLLTEEGWLDHVAIGDIAPAVRTLLESKPVVLITGHVGNWEVLGYTVALLGFPMHGVYRPLDLAPLDRWVRETRARRGLVLVDKYSVVHSLPGLVRRGVPAAFVADQNGGDRGVFVPFFNRLTATYKSIGLLALQFQTRVICGYAHRPEGSRRGRSVSHVLDVADNFGPEDWSTHPDPLFYLTARYRRAIETMIRRVPDQYDWLHRVWRSRPRHERLGRPMPAGLREKIRLLPWITDADMETIEAHSVRDARTLAETGQTRLS